MVTIIRWPPKSNLLVRNGMAGQRLLRASIRSLGRRLVAVLQAVVRPSSGCRSGRRSLAALLVAYQSPRRLKVRAAKITNLERASRAFQQSVVSRAAIQRRSSGDRQSPTTTRRSKHNLISEFFNFKVAFGQKFWAIWSGDHHFGYLTITSVPWLSLRRSLRAVHSPSGALRVYA